VSAPKTLKARIIKNVLYNTAQTRTLYSQTLKSGLPNNGENVTATKLSEFCNATLGSQHGIDIVLP